MHNTTIDFFSRIPALVHNDDTLYILTVGDAGLQAEPLGTNLGPLVLDGRHLAHELGLCLPKDVGGRLLDDGGAELGVKAKTGGLAHAALDADKVGTLGPGRRLQSLLVGQESDAERRQSTG